MTTVRHLYGSPAPDGTYPPVDGVVIWTPTDRRIIEGSPDTIVMPIGFKIKLPETTKVVVAPTGVDWVWRVDEQIKGINRTTKYVAVPDTLEELDFNDLVEVDPETIEPAFDPEPVWLSWYEDLKADAEAAASGTIKTGVVNSEGHLILERSDNVLVDAGSVYPPQITFTVTDTFSEPPTP